ncbi:hypothetical protein GCM10027273_14990 [Nocardioides pakistanensis]
MGDLPLPNVVVIGAMKCATSALHAYLDAHPDISMTATKELNFFNGPEQPPHDDPTAGGGPASGTAGWSGTPRSSTRTRRSGASRRRRTPHRTSRRCRTGWRT